MTARPGVESRDEVHYLNGRVYGRLPHVLYMRPMLLRYLHSGAAGVEWYVTRGEAVPRNQFGTHPWFSRR